MEFHGFKCRKLTVNIATAPSRRNTFQRFLLRFKRRPATMTA